MSIELILGVGPALATESPRRMGTLLENVQTSHNSRPWQRRVVEAGRKITGLGKKKGIIRARGRKRIAGAGRRRRRRQKRRRRKRRWIIKVVAGLNKSCQ